MRPPKVTSSEPDEFMQNVSIWQELKSAWKHDYSEADWEGAVDRADGLSGQTVDAVKRLARLFEYRGSTHNNFAALRYGEPNRLAFDPAIGDDIISRAGYCDDIMPGFMQGLNSLMPFAWPAGSEAVANAFHPFEQRGALSVSGKAVAVASCDPSYFHAFAEEYAGSLGALNPDLEIVILIVAEAPLPEAEALVAGNPRLTVWYARPEHPCRSQFANARLFAASQVLREGADAVYLTDIDARFHASMQHFLRALKGHTDYPALKVQKPLRLPWYYAMAGFLYLPNTFESRRFLRGVCSYIEALYRQRPEHATLWYSDQNALILGLAHLQINFVRVGNQIFRHFWDQYGATKTMTKSNKKIT